ncbi:MAG TPA: hypothetical protein VN132_13620 [Bdellovibrio sp.]|nr:hypothetical protein [Bdellovibrio sp.]
MFSKMNASYVIGLCFLFLAGCQTVPYQGQARETKLKPKEGGIIALKENFRDEDRAVAEQKMRRNCDPLPFRILEEGEAVVGQTTNSNTHDTKRDDSRSTVGTLFGLPITSGEAGGKDSSSSSTTTALKEWQITYQCEAAQKKVKR